MRVRRVREINTEFSGDDYGFVAPGRVEEKAVKIGADSFA